MYKMKKAKSLEKPPSLIPPYNITRDSESDIQFELELCWCIQQLQVAIQTRTLNKRVYDDTIKSIKTLKSKSVPFVKKRQLMKTIFGDYRAKMKKEEKQMALVSRQIQFKAEVENSKKFSFVKKSSFQTSGKDFRFDFTVPDACPEEESSQSEKIVPESTVVIREPLNLNKNEPFKFNFNINVQDENNDLNIDHLSLNN